LDGDAAGRARAWHHARHAAVCDVARPWAHGTVVRATRYPSYYDFNLVRVEDDPAMSVDALIAFADDANAGLPHRRLDFDRIDAAEPPRRDFEARGWRTMSVVMMRHETPPPPGSDVAVEEVPYDAVHDLRVAWHREDFPDLDLRAMAGPAILFYTGAVCGNAIDPEAMAERLTNLLFAPLAVDAEA